MEIGQDVLALNLREGPKWYHAKVTPKLGINIYDHVKQPNIIWKRSTKQRLTISPNLVCVAFLLHRNFLIIIMF